MRSLSLCVHGEPGTGKSWLGSTAPTPRLVLDAEGGSRFAPGQKVKWNPLTEAPPAADGWDTCLVRVTEYPIMEKAYQWLASGQHPFRSVVIDSVTELQKRMIDQVAGTNQPSQQEWGDIFRGMEFLIRQIRDLMFHPTQPLECVVLIALTHQRDGKFRPFVKGQLELTLPGFIDIVGYLYVQQNAAGELERKMLIAPIGEFDAKDRTHVITEQNGYVITNPDLGIMLQQMEQAT